MICCKQRLHKYIRQDAKSPILGLPFIFSETNPEPKKQVSRDHPIAKFDQWEALWVHGSNYSNSKPERCMFLGLLFVTTKGIG